MLIEEQDREAILSPIDGGVGVDGRIDEGEAGLLLREIRSQRTTLVRAEQANSIGRNEELPEDAWSWEEIGGHARDYLARHGKDLEPMCTLLEATVRMESGPAELGSAMAVLAELVEKFWDAGLYPAEDEEGVETRFQPLSGLSGGSNDRPGAIILPVRRMVLAATAEGELRYGDKVMADAIATKQTGDAGAKAARSEETEQMFRSFERIAMKAGRAQLQPVRDAIAEAEVQWRRAIEYIMKKASPAMPAGSQLSTELRAIASWLTSLLEKLPPEPGMDEGAEVESEEVTGGEQGVANKSAGQSARAFTPGKIVRREDALLAVSAAAEYFVLYEPQSPIGRSLQEVERRARMSHIDLIAELIPDASARENYLWRSGIRPPVPAEDEGG